MLASNDMHVCMLSFPWFLFAGGELEGMTSCLLLDRNTSSSTDTGMHTIMTLHETRLALQNVGDRYN